MRAWREAKKEKVRKASQRYYKRHSDSIIQREKQQRADRKAATVSVTDETGKS